MTLLLDTSVWLWWLSGDPSLSSLAIQQIENPENQVVVSAISVWEVTVKSQSGRFWAQGDLETATLDSGITFISFTGAHASAVANLPFHHRDLFDRALIAQAAHDHLRLVAANPLFVPYRDAADILLV